MKTIFFDNAATTPLDNRVVEAMHQVMLDCYGNPSSSHAEGRKAKSYIEKSRKKIAELLGVKSNEIIFTSGGTEADNMALRCAVRDLGIKNIISSPIEHHAVGHTIDELEYKNKIRKHLLSLDYKGHINYDELEKKLSENSHVLVSLMHSNNEIGNITDIEKVGELCKKYNAIFHSDTVQTMGHYKIDFSKWNIDFAIGAAHKFRGPKGIGLLYIRQGTKIKSLIKGGAQERDLRGGTENIYGIVGMAKALELAIEEMNEEQNHLKNLKKYMAECFIQNFNDIKFNGDYNGLSSNTVLNVGIDAGSASEMLLFNLDIKGVCASAGSACNSGANIGSHVLQAIGANMSLANIRFSFGKQNTIEDVDFAIQALKEILSIQSN